MTGNTRVTKPVDLIGIQTLQYLSLYSGHSWRSGWEISPRYPNELPDDNRDLEPPDPMPNSEVKQIIANGSVALRHVRVGHRQGI